jgi:hypothetical protein
MTTIAVTVVLLMTQLVASVAQERMQEPPTTDAPDASATPSIRSFADTDKLCVEWTDGCHACRRVGADEPACSNIGIACQPKEITCTRREDATK